MAGIELKTDMKKAVKVKSIKLISQKAETALMKSTVFRVDRSLGMESPTGARASLLFTLMSLVSGKQG